MSLLIDGHNLIGALPNIELGARDDEMQLLIRLRAYRSLTGRTMIVFFDSGAMPGAAGDLSTPGLQVRFAQRPQTADDLIIAFLRRCAQPGQYAVVTNDRELAGRARQLGASILPARAFAAKLSAPRQRAQQPPLADDTPNPRDPVFADFFERFLAAERDGARFRGQQAQTFEWWQERLYGDDAALAESAVFWLARFGQRVRAEPLLLDALTHTQARVRAAAAVTLGRLKATAAVPALAERLRSDPSALVREAAAQALGRFATPLALSALQTALHDPKRKVRKAAAAVLQPKQAPGRKRPTSAG